MVIAVESTLDKFVRYRETRSAKLRDELIEAHKNLVRFLASKFKGKGEPLEDLISVGYIGLINAVDRFDPGRGNQFVTYATPTIVGEIRRHFRDKAWDIQPPGWLQELNYQVISTIDRIKTETGEEPSISELAKIHNRSEEHIFEALMIKEIYNIASLESPIIEGGESRSELVADINDAIGRIDNQDEVRRLLAKLPPRQAEVLRRRFADGDSQTVVGQKMKLSQMHVSRLEANAKHNLKRIAEGKPVIADNPMKRWLARKVSNSLVIFTSTTVARIAIAVWPHLKVNTYQTVDWKKVAEAAGLSGYTTHLYRSHLVNCGVIQKRLDKSLSSWQSPVYTYRRGISRFHYKGLDILPLADGLWLKRDAEFELDLITSPQLRLPARVRMEHKNHAWFEPFDGEQLAVTAYLWQFLPEMWETSNPDQDLPFQVLMNSFGVSRTTLQYILVKAAKNKVFVRSGPICHGRANIRIFARVRIPELGITGRSCNLDDVACRMQELAAQYTNGYVEQLLKQACGRQCRLTSVQAKAAILLYRLVRQGLCNDPLDCLTRAATSLSLNHPEVTYRELIKNHVVIQPIGRPLICGIDKFELCCNARSIEIYGRRYKSGEVYSISEMIRRIELDEVQQLPCLVGNEILIGAATWVRTRSKYDYLDKVGLSRTVKKDRGAVATLLRKLVEKEFFSINQDEYRHGEETSFRVAQKTTVLNLTFEPGREYNLREVACSIDWTSAARRN